MVLTQWNVVVQALEAFQKLMEANGDFDGEEKVLLQNEGLRKLWETET